MIYLKDGDKVLRTVTDIRFRDLASVLRSVSVVRIRDAANISRIVWQRLAVTGTSYVEGYGSSNSPISITTSAPNPSVAGGRTPYSYAWTTGSAGWTILYTTQLNTSFRKTGVANGVNYTGLFTLTVTDADGNTATFDVSAYVENFGGV